MYAVPLGSSCFFSNLNMLKHKSTKMKTQNCKDKNMKT